TNKLRAKAIFISFFYSKVDFYDDVEYIFPLEIKRHQETAKKFNSYFFSWERLENFKKIEAFCFLALVINYMDLMIENLKKGVKYKGSGGLFMHAMYLLFMTSMHQFPKLLSKEENSFFDEFYKNVWQRKEVFSLDIEYFYKIVSFFDRIIDQIIIQNIDLFLTIPGADTRVSDLFNVVSRNQLFPCLNEELFREDFNKIKRDESDISTYTIPGNYRDNRLPDRCFVVNSNIQDGQDLYKELLNKILEKI
ncbi:MAG: hypothetical protein ABIF12_02635, partial [bacterium]